MRAFAGGISRGSYKKIRLKIYLVVYMFRVCLDVKGLRKSLARDDMLCAYTFLNFSSQLINNVCVYERVHLMSRRP